MASKYLSGRRGRQVPHFRSLTVPQRTPADRHIPRRSCHPGKTLIRASAPGFKVPGSLCLRSAARGADQSCLNPEGKFAAP
jgi:hypothetical protein